MGLAVAAARAGAAVIDAAVRSPDALQVRAKRPNAFVTQVDVASEAAIVRTLLAAHPELLNARSPLDESALGAAAHVGNREVARFLLDQGAPLEICTAAMLADRAAVAAFLEDPAQARAVGAHGIPLLTHAKMGGDNALPVLEYLQSLG
mgnify:CR=1 FL=1